MTGAAAAAPAQIVVLDPFTRRGPGAQDESVRLS
jgi:hypothetical protein